MYSSEVMMPLLIVLILQKSECAFQSILSVLLNGTMEHIICYARVKKKPQQNWGLVFLPIICKGQ